MTRAKSSAELRDRRDRRRNARTTHITHDTPREWSNGHPIWSHDGKWLAWTQHHANGKNSNVLVAELASGKILNLTAHDGDITYSAASWSPDGKRLLITSNAANGYENVALLDLDGQLRWLASEKREMHAGSFSPDGTKVTWTVNVDGNTAIYLRLKLPRDNHGKNRGAAAAARESTRWPARTPLSAAMDAICSSITPAPTLPANW